MYFAIPFIAAYIVYAYVYRGRIKEVNQKIDSINRLVEAMEKDEIIIGMIQDFKKDFTLFKNDVNSELKSLRTEVTTLKTKAGFIGSLSGGVVSVIVAVIVSLIK